MADVNLFLINRFEVNLQEAVEKWQEELPLLNELQKIRYLLPKRGQMPRARSRRDELKDYLLELNRLLAKCVMIAQQRRETRRAKKASGNYPASLSDWKSSASHLAKKHWDLIRIQRRLIEMKRILEYGEDETDETVLSSSILVLKPEAFRYFHKSTIYGLQEQVEDIEKELAVPKTKDKDHKRAPKQEQVEDTEKKLRAIGIIGMGGSGKTALAQLVFHSPMPQYRFELRLWIDFSKATDAEEKYYCILSENSAADGYIKSPCRYSLDEVLSTLYSYIENRRCLVVLDGIWHGNEGIKDFVNEISGVLDGAVIITSRNWDVARLLVGKDGHLHGMRPLDRRDCWFIFMDSLVKKSLNLSSGERDSLSRLMREMEEEIMDRCDGLPLAAKTLAEVMPFQKWTDDEWVPSSPSSSSAGSLKTMLFEVNVYDRLSLSAVWYKVLNLPGVDVEHTSYNKNTFLVRGTCHPSDVAAALGKYCHLELIDRF